MNKVNPKILFVGNSITFHDKAPEIGWNGNWGMAASEMDKDYVHQTMNFIKKIKPEASYLIAQAWEWERNYRQGSKILAKLFMEDFLNPDILIIRIGENIQTDISADYPLNQAFLDLINFFNSSGESKTIITSLFWFNNEINCALKETSEKINAPFVDISAFGSDNEMMVIGLFEHDGVARHPGDKGMKAIADSICKIIEPFLLQ